VSTRSTAVASSARQDRAAEKVKIVYTGEGDPAVFGRVDSLDGSRVVGEAGQGRLDRAPEAVGRAGRNGNAEERSHAAGGPARSSGISRPCLVTARERLAPYAPPRQMPITTMQGLSMWIERSP
jgi:hypothetical protein